MFRQGLVILFFIFLARAEGAKVRLPNTLSFEPLIASPNVGFLGQFEVSVNSYIECAVKFHDIHHQNALFVAFQYSWSCCIFRLELGSGDVPTGYWW